MQDLALRLLVVAMMVSVGLHLRPADLLAGLNRRGALGLALLVNLAVVPLGTAWAVRALGFEEGVVAGLILCASAPGGPTGPAFARMAGGALGFSTALMILLGLVGMVSGPLTVAWLLGSSAGGTDLFWPMLWTLAVYQILPLSLAMAARGVAPALAERLAGPISRVANGLLLAIIVGMLYTRGQVLMEVPGALHLLLVGTYVVGLAPILIVPRGEGILRGAALVTALRNMSVALLLSGRFFADPTTDVTVLVCGFWMMLLPAAFAWGASRRIEGPAPSP